MALYWVLVIEMGSLGFLILGGSGAFFIRLMFLKRLSFRYSRPVAVLNSS